MVFAVAQGAFSNGVGGMDGSAMLTADEQAWTDNALPFAFIPYVKAALVCRRRLAAMFHSHSSSQSSRRFLHCCSSIAGAMKGN
jgi:hypothetical protein